MQELLGDHAAMNMLYLETVFELEKGQWQVDTGALERLMSLKKSGSKKEVIRRFFRTVKLILVNSGCLIML